VLSVVPLTKYVDDTEHWTLECWSFVRLCKDHTSIDRIDKHWSLCMPFELWFVGLIGLGTSTAKEAKEYFSDMARHRIPFKYSNTEDDTAIELVGSVTYSNMYPKFRLLVVLWHVTYSVCWYCRPKTLFMKFLILWHWVARWGGWWRWALVSPDGVAPSRMVGVFASVNLPLLHKVQTFFSGTGSPGWFRKKGRKLLWCGGWHILYFIYAVYV